MKRILYLLPLILIGCSPRIVYIPTETVRVVEKITRDTTIMVRIDQIRDSVSVSDTLSILSNKYSYSVAEWHSGVLNHSIVTKDVAIPVRVQYIDISTHDTTTKTIVQPLSMEDQKRINGYDKLKASNDKNKADKWKLIGLLAIAVLWILRKPLLKLIL